MVNDNNNNNIIAIITTIIIVIIIIIIQQLLRLGFLFLSDPTAPRTGAPAHRRTSAPAHSHPHTHTLNPHEPDDELQVCKPSWEPAERSAHCVQTIVHDVVPPKDLHCQWEYIPGRCRNARVPLCDCSNCKELSQAILNICYASHSPHRSLW